MGNFMRGESARENEVAHQNDGGHASLCPPYGSQYRHSGVSHATCVTPAKPGSSLPSRLGRELDTGVRRYDAEVLIPESHASNTLRVTSSTEGRYHEALRWWDGVRRPRAIFA